MNGDRERKRKKAKGLRGFLGGNSERKEGRAAGGLSGRVEVLDTEEENTKRPRLESRGFGGDRNTSKRKERGHRVTAAKAGERKEKQKGYGGELHGVAHD